MCFAGGVWVMGWGCFLLVGVGGKTERGKEGGKRGERGGKEGGKREKGERG